MAKGPLEFGHNENSRDILNSVKLHQEKELTNVSNFSKTVSVKHKMATGRR